VALTSCAQALAVIDGAPPGPAAGSGSLSYLQHHSYDYISL
jgi:hypothetical protein